MTSKRVPFTDLLIQKLKAPSSGQIELFDARAPGLSIRCGASGTKAFYLTYRLKGDRKRRRGKLGVYPVMKLVDARDARIDTLSMARRGIDPFADKADAKELEKQPFDVCAERFIAEHVERKSKRPSDASRIIRKEFIPVWGAREVREITKADVRDILNAIVERGAGVSANRALARVRKLFNWLVDVDVLDRSPCYRLPTPVAEISRDRVLSDRELRVIWFAADRCRYPYAPFLKLLVLLGQRRSEVAAVRWAHLDLDAGLWTMTNRSTKNSETHLLPLPRLAVEILKDCPRVGDSPFVFPSAHDDQKHLTGFTVMKAKLDKLSGVREWVLNDCRRSMATHMPALGVDETIIERIQNHKVAAGSRVSQVQRVYNRYKYAPQMLDALEKWSNHLQGKILLASSADANVSNTERPVVL